MFNYRFKSNKSNNFLKNDEIKQKEIINKSNIKDDLELQNLNKNSNLRQDNREQRESVQIKSFLKEDSFKQIEAKQKEDFSDKLKEELNELKQLTNQADYIMTDKQDKANKKQEVKNTEDKENDEKKNKENILYSFKKKEEIKQSKRDDSNIKLSNMIYINSNQSNNLEEEFEEKLSYIIDKLDIINKITK